MPQASHLNSSSIKLHGLGLQLCQQGVALLLGVSSLRRSTVGQILQDAAPVLGLPQLGPQLLYTLHLLLQRLLPTCNMSKEIHDAPNSASHVTSKGTYNSKSLIKGINQPPTPPHPHQGNKRREGLLREVFKACVNDM